MPIPGSGRNSVGSKSPLTGGFGESEAGGFWSAELKAAGFDEIIIEGKSDQPVYLFIKEGMVELRDARHLWGMDVGQAHFAIQDENQDRRIRTAIIGPGGERMIRFACILNEHHPCSGAKRTGGSHGVQETEGNRGPGPENAPSIR